MPDGGRCSYAAVSISVKRVYRMTNSFARRFAVRWASSCVKLIISVTRNPLFMASNNNLVFVCHLTILVFGATTYVQMRRVHFHLAYRQALASISQSHRYEVKYRRPPLPLCEMRWLGYAILRMPCLHCRTPMSLTQINIKPHTSCIIQSSRIQCQTKKQSKRGIDNYWGEKICHTTCSLA